jgi:molybdopterin converting factor small subunit
LKAGSGSLNLTVSLRQPDETVFEFLTRLAEVHGEEMKRALFDDETHRLRPSILLSLNGHVVDRASSQEQLLSPGDEIALLPAFAGGYV